MIAGGQQLVLEFEAPSTGGIAAELGPSGMPAHRGDDGLSCRGCGLPLEVWGSRPLPCASCTGGPTK
jgi:hypothetical protein